MEDNKKMRYFQKIIIRGFLLMGIISLVSAEEPVIKTSGSVEVASSFSNKGKASFKTETLLGIEISFTDNLSGKIEASAQSSHQETSPSFQQAYLQLGKNSSSLSDSEGAIGKLPNLGKTHPVPLDPLEKKLVKKTARETVKPLGLEKPLSVLAQTPAK